MQQVHAHKENKIFRKIIREKISLYWKFDESSDSYLVKEIEDYILPSVVYNYYTYSSIDCFKRYLENIEFNKKCFSFITNSIDKHLEGISLDKTSKNRRLLGDIHPGRVTKCLINDKIVYNNYPDYGQLLNSLSSLIFSDSERFFPKIEKKGNTFLRNYIPVNIETNNLSIISEFYFNIGRIIPFLLLLRAIDINAENIIVDLPYPLFFDMESIFSGEFSDDLEKYNIKNSGIVKVTDKNDSSVLTGGILERESLLKPLICGNGNKPYIVWRTISRGKYDNIPFLNGQKINPSKYFKCIKAGFKETSEKIIRKREEVSQLVKELDCCVRVIIRPTRIYRLLILKSCYPQIYNRLNVKKFLIDSLNSYNFIYQFKNIDLLDIETEAMMDFQIPVFYSNIKDTKIVSSLGKDIGVWNRTQYQIWNDYAQNIDAKFYAKQLQIIEKAIA